MQFGGQTGGLAQMAKARFQPGGGGGMPYRGVPPQRSPIQPGGGYGRPGGVPGTIGGFGGYQGGGGGGGGLAQMIQSFMQQQRGQQPGGGMMQPGGPGGPVQPGGPGGPLGGGKQLPGRRIAPPPGKQPGLGGLGQYRRAGGFGGGTRTPQLPGGGRSRIMGRSPPGGGPNPLLRTAGAASQNQGNRLNQMMGRRGAGYTGMRFAVGGKVAKKSNA